MKWAVKLLLATAQVLKLALLQLAWGRKLWQLIQVRALTLMEEPRDSETEGQV